MCFDIALQVQSAHLHRFVLVVVHIDCVDFDGTKFRVKYF